MSSIQMLPIQPSYTHSLLVSGPRVTISSVASLNRTVSKIKSISTIIVYVSNTSDMRYPLVANYFKGDDFLIRYDAMKSLSFKWKSNEENA